MKRRNFIQRVIVGVAAVGAAALPYALIQWMAPIRSAFGRNHRPLPGALTDVAAFEAACIGCGLCGEVCPPKCVLFHQSDNGASNTPYIDPVARACTLCGKCMDVCPTEALNPVATADIDMGIAQIDRTACYPWIDHGVCGACATICPLGPKAISFEFANLYRPAVQPGCVGCGICVEVCPHPSKPIWIVDRSEAVAARRKG
ncbi:MAG: 4Fe-4S dicluster domain-containing protein [Rhodospirillaceae bacterium]|nr:4Fe-4S dicluster domain-containing protein [Rhodospirillaceae bacterium]MBT6136143.1 4Fe-4S dicluster domain-containing protein [Rhodospirillaceae bacterium]